MPGLSTSEGKMSIFFSNIELDKRKKITLKKKFYKKFQKFFFEKKFPEKVSEANDNEPWDSTEFLLRTPFSPVSIFRIPHWSKCPFFWKDSKPLGGMNWESSCDLSKGIFDENNVGRRFVKFNFIKLVSSSSLAVMTNHYFEYSMDSNLREYFQENSVKKISKFWKDFFIIVYSKKIHCSVIPRFFSIPPFFLNFIFRFLKCIKILFPFEFLFSIYWWRH